MKTEPSKPIERAATFPKTGEERGRLVGQLSGVMVSAAAVIAAGRPLIGALILASNSWIVPVTAGLAMYAVGDVCISAGGCVGAYVGRKIAEWSQTDDAAAEEAPPH